MSPLGFLVIALVVGVGGCLLVVALNRAPQGGDSAMRDFEREMQALAPPEGIDRPRRSDGSGGVIVDGTRRGETSDDDADPSDEGTPRSAPPRPDAGRGDG
ncbi:MAG: hypothetical protein ACXIVQ_05900 [Acidimicrobiales bacterium]